MEYQGPAVVSVPIVVVVDLLHGSSARHRETIAAAKRNTRTFVPWVGAEDTHGATRMRRESQVPFRRAHGGGPFPRRSCIPFENLSVVHAIWRDKRLHMRPIRPVMCRAIVAVWVACTPQVSVARAEPAIAKIVGLGATPCAQFEQEANEHPRGFGLRSQLDFLKEHCREHPAETISDASIELYKRLRREGAT
jgi:hypothetical protein